MSVRSSLNFYNRVIVDEADSVLIDEARTPLILSGEVESRYDAATCRRALTAAAELRVDKDFRRDARRREIRSTAAGRRRLDVLAAPSEGRWASPLFREEAIRQDLSALHLFRRDVDYLVRDGKVRIVDEHTGRVFADRAWSMGLHQLMEVKEGLEPSPERITLDRLTSQSLFRRYRHLAGMTGTIRDVAGEVWQVYGVRTASIATHEPVRPRLLTERHDARRIDDQLIGRCARQGEPGIAEAYLVLDGGWRDPVRTDRLGRLLLPLAVRVARIGAWLLGRSQRRLEGAHAWARGRLLAAERNADRTLASPVNGNEPSSSRARFPSMPTSETCHAAALLPNRGARQPPPPQGLGRQDGE